MSLLLAGEYPYTRPPRPANWHGVIGGEGSGRGGGERLNRDSHVTMGLRDDGSDRAYGRFYLASTEM